MSVTETPVEVCRICVADATGDRDVDGDEDIPLCARHWPLWGGRYLWPSEEYPPCSAHLIETSDERPSS
jgi:hypothetical protein